MNVEQLRDTYRRMIDNIGEWIVLRRYTGQGANRPRFDVNVRAAVRGYGPEELVGSIRQGDREIIILSQDLIDKQFALPITENDRAVVRGKELAVMAPDDSTIRIGPSLIAYKFTGRG
jgi:hypothetical protein